MFLQRLKPKIPSQRFQTIVLWPFKKYLKLSFFIFKHKRHNLDSKGSRIFPHIKQKFNARQQIHQCFLKNVLGKFCVITNLFNSSNRKQSLVLKNIYNQTVIYPHLNTLFYKFRFNFLQSQHLYNIRLINHLTTLKKIPQYFKLSNIQNNIKSKITYSISPNTYALRIKFIKNFRLTVVKLPSENLKFFNSNTLCIFGKNIDYDISSLSYGKFGHAFKKKNKIIVRGVAKNPVDHPNGGRTKAKQPEKSPWGWIAKHNK